jgi:PAS domain S-box-containing protein
MKLALAAGGALLLALLTWLLLHGIDTNASAYADTRQALDDFALAEAAIGRDVLQARAGLLGNYDLLAEAEEAMESAARRIRLHIEAKNLDSKPVEALAAAVGQYEDLIERFKTGNSLLQNSLSYVGQLSTDPAFGALGDQFAASATALAAAVLRLAHDSSPESAKSLQQHINRFEAQAPTGGLEGEAAHALLAHARLLSDLLPEVDQTLQAFVAAPSRQPFEKTRELVARAQADFETTAQRFRVVLYAVSLALLVIALRLSQRLWTRTLRIRRLVDANIIGIFLWELDGRIIEANDAFLRMVGYDHEDIASGRMAWTTLTPPEWLDRDERRRLPELKVTGSLQPFEKEYFRKDGSRVPVLTGVATFEESGNQGVAFVLDLTERKRAEKALRDSEEALRRNEAWLTEAQRLSHTGTWVLNPATMRYLYWSDESYRIWGFDPLQGLPSRDALWERIHDRDSVWEKIQEALRQKKDYSGEFKIVLPDGTVKYLAATSHHVFSTNGELVEVIGTNVDVTERKRVEERLRVQHMVAQILAEAATIEEASPRILRAMGESLGWDLGTLWRVDRQAEALRCVELWHKTSIEVPEFERASREFTFGPGLGLPGRVWSSLEPEYIPDVVLDENFPRAPTAEREGLRAAFGFPILLGGEVLGVIEFFSREIKQPDQELLNVLATIGSQIGQFIERKRAEEALRESERSARSAIDGIAGLVAIMAPNGEVETVNRQAFEYFGRSLEWLKNWGTNDAVHPEDLPRVAELFKKAIASGIPFNYELRLRRFDGKYRWFDTRHLPIRDDSGRIARWYLLATDIEDRTRALAQLEQMQSDFAHMNRVSVMGELAASLSHETTQPIGSARNNARAAWNFLEMQPPDLGEVREALSCVVGDIDRAGDIVARIRDHIRKAPPQKGQFDLNEAINEVITLGRSAIIKNGVSAQTRLSEGLFPVHGDRVQLQQVVLNLLLNAVEAMGSSEAGARELLISTEQDHTGVLVAVRDSGPGLDPSHLEHVFDAFYTTKSSGMGMGLSICRSIITAHGGRLWAEANEPRGAVFQFTLPAVMGELREGAVSDAVH